MRMIVKEEDGTVKIGYDPLDDSDEFVFETLEEYLRKDSSLNREPLR
jgi:S-adenosylmethionine synthetase